MPALLMLLLLVGCAPSLDERFVGTWLIAQNEPLQGHALAFHDSGELELLRNYGLPECTSPFDEGCTLTSVVQCDSEAPGSPCTDVRCVFANRWRAIDDEHLTIASVCSDDRPRDIELEVPHAWASTVPIVLEAGGVTGWTPAMRWAWLPCETRESTSCF